MLKPDSTRAPIGWEFGRFWGFSLHPIINDILGLFFFCGSDFQDRDQSKTHFLPTFPKPLYRNRESLNWIILLLSGVFGGVQKQPVWTFNNNKWLFKTFVNSEPDGAHVQADHRQRGQLCGLGGPHRRHGHQRLGPNLRLQPGRLSADGRAGVQRPVGRVHHLPGPVPLRGPRADPDPARWDHPPSGAQQW